MEERQKPWAVCDRETSVRGMQIKYTWETSIPDIWKKIKGERFFQRHRTKLQPSNSYDLLPAIDKSLFPAVQPLPLSPLRTRPKLPHPDSKPKLKLDESKDLSDTVTDPPFLGNLILVSQEGTLRESVPQSIKSNASCVHFGSTQKLPEVSRFTACKDCGHVSKSMFQVSPAQPLLRQHRKTYSKAVIGNEKVEQFMSRFERNQGAKEAKVGRKGFMGQKLPWSKHKDLNWQGNK